MNANVMFCSRVLFLLRILAYTQTNLTCDWQRERGVGRRLGSGRMF